MLQPLSAAHPFCFILPKRRGKRQIMQELAFFHSKMHENLHFACEICHKNIKNIVQNK
jgi:hypothetical protein